MNIREQVRRLWLEVFDDEDDFVNIYFSRIYTHIINHTVEHDGKVVAALQAIPFRFKVGDRLLKTAYLSGIATDPGYQRRGFMRQLLDKTHRNLQAQGYDAAWLIPAEDYLFDVYSAFGYKTAFYRDYRAVDTASIAEPAKGITVGSLDENDRERAYLYFHSQQMRQSCGVVLPKNFFDVVVDVFALEHDHVVVAKAQQTIVGIAFVLSQGKVIQLFASSPGAEQAIFAYIHNNLKIKNIELKTNGKAAPYGMMLLFGKDLELPPGLLPQVSLMLDE